MPIERPQVIGLLKSIHPFRKLNDPQIEQVADSLRDLAFNPGEMIYEQGSIDDRLFIILSGQVRFTRWVDGEENKLGVLLKGDVFGFEMWREGLARHTEAQAVGNVTLLWLDWFKVDQLAAAIPLMEVYMQEMFDSFELTIFHPLNWRAPEEAIYYMGRMHPIFLLQHLLAPGFIALASLFLTLYLYIFRMPGFFVFLAGMLVILGMILWGIWVYLDWSNDFYVVTSRRVVEINHVILLYENRMETPLDAVNSVGVSTSYWGRWFSYGDLEIRTYTDKMYFKRVTQVALLASLIEEKTKRSSSERFVMEKRERVEAVRKKLYPPPAQPAAVQAATKPAEQPIPTLREWLAELFDLRVVKGDMVTYRTHWFILLNKVLVQSLFLLAFIGLPFISLLFPFTGLSTSIVTFFSAFGGVACVLWWLYSFLDWRNDQYILTSEQISDVTKKPFAKEEKRSAPLKNIQSIEYKRLGFIGLLFNFGTVYIHIGDADFTFDNVANPAEVQRDIFHRLAKQKQKARQVETENERKQILEWLEAYHDVIKDDREKR